MATKKAASKAKSTAKKTVKKAETKPTKTTETKVKTVQAKDKETFSNAFMKPAFIGALLAEFVGTFFLASGIIAGQGQPLILFFLLTAIVLVIGNVSGAHVNPLISFGAWATKRISSVRLFGYVLAQVLGAMLAFIVLNAFVSQAPEPTAQQVAYGQSVSLFTAAALPSGQELVVLFAELLGSIIFAFAVASVTADKKKNETSVALGVGGGLFVAALIAGSSAAVISATAIINPAVAISLQAFSIEGTNTTWAIAIYAVTAIVGGIIGFALSSVIEKARSTEK